MIPKVHGIAKNFRDMADQLLAGVADGRTPATFAIDDTVDQIDHWLAKPIDEDPILQTAEPTGVADADAWRARIREAVETDVRPAMAAYRDTIRDRIRPHARDDDARRAHVARRRRRRLRHADPLPHDPDEVGPGDPRDRARAGREARRRVPRPRPGGPRHRRRARDLPPAPRGSGAAPHERRRHRRRLEGGARQGDRRRWATGSGSCRRPAATSRRRSPARSPSTSRRRRTARAAGVFFMNTSDPTGLGPLPDRGDLVPRGDPGPSPPARDLDRADRHPGVPEARLHRRVRRGLGPVQRAARRRDGHLLDAARPDGDARGRFDAGLPARRRHRDARARLEPAAGDRLHDRRTRRWRVGQIVAGDRPVRGDAGPGARLHDRPARDPADPPGGGGRPRRRGSTSRPSTTRSSAPG